ncbi:MAG TPA: hypothetical protein P5567_08100 [Kiritimatiellia bacterium]|nr:hypothetical protein [Kiritimatiellia bacterium]HRZ12402.1 hypothetical protein [Kiritimatiellia bacterium]HSA17840.1 hypothetical protein [Kiritimatiellia bacterium]
MRNILGVVCILFGALGWIGQLISAVNYALAQRLGLQEKSEGTDPLFRTAERNAARWDSLVLWTLILAGVLMLLDSRWWPPVALVAGGIYLDGAGREVAKVWSLKSQGIRIGTPGAQRVQKVFFTMMAAIALGVLACAFRRLAG